MANFPFISFFQMCKQATSVEPEHRAELVLLVPIKWCLLRCHISGICPMARSPPRLSHERMTACCLKSDPIADHFAAGSLTQSVNQIDSALSEMESKVSVPFFSSLGMFSGR